MFVSMNSYSTLPTFPARAPESSLLFDHITRRLAPESNHRKQFASSSAVHTWIHFSRHSVLLILVFSTFLLGIFLSCLVVVQTLFLLSFCSSQTVLKFVSLLWSHIATVLAEAARRSTPEKFEKLELLLGSTMSSRECSGEDPTAWRKHATARTSEISLDSHRHEKSSASPTFRGDQTTLVGWKWSIAVTGRAKHRNIFDDFQRVEEQPNPRLQSFAPEQQAKGHLGATVPHFMRLFVMRKRQLTNMSNGMLQLPVRCVDYQLPLSLWARKASSFLHTFFFHDAWLHAIFSEYHTLVVRGDIDEDGSSCWYAF